MLPEKSLKKMFNPQVSVLRTYRTSRTQMMALDFVKDKIAFGESKNR